MKPAHMILLLVAILAGGLAAFLATRGGDAPSDPQVVTELVEEQKAQVLVAKGPIGVGQRLSPDLVEWQDWPETAVRGEYITIAGAPEAPNQLNDAVARFEFFTGEPIREAKLVRADQGYLSAVLPQGMRGVSISVSAESGAGGFITPNDRVDVVLSRSGGASQVSETILANVKVLAIGKRLGEMGTTGAPQNAEANPASETFDGLTIATLELAPPQAEMVINAQKVGSLSLILRSIVDFGESPGAARENSTNQPIRMIRYGHEASVMAGQTPNAPAASPSVPAAPIMPTSSTGNGIPPVSTAPLLPAPAASAPIDLAAPPVSVQ